MTYNVLNLALSISTNSCNLLCTTCRDLLLFWLQFFV